MGISGRSNIGMVLLGFYSSFFCRPKKPCLSSLAILVCALAIRPLASSQTSADAWLRYSALSPREAQRYVRLPDDVAILHESVVLKTAQQELVRGIGKMTGRTLRTASGA